MHGTHALRVASPVLGAVIYLRRVARLDPLTLDAIGLLSLVTTWSLLGMKLSQASAHVRFRYMRQDISFFFLGADSGALRLVEVRKGSTTCAHACVCVKAWCSLTNANLQKQRKKCKSLSALRQATGGGQATMLLETDAEDDAAARNARARSLEMESIPQRPSACGSEPA